MQAKECKLIRVKGQGIRKGNDVASGVRIPCIGLTQTAHHRRRVEKVRGKENNAVPGST